MSQFTRSDPASMPVESPLRPAHVLHRLSSHRRAREARQIPVPALPVAVPKTVRLGNARPAGVPLEPPPLLMYFSSGRISASLPANACNR